jgi:integrase
MRLFQRADNGVYYVELERNRKRSLKTTDELTAKRRFKELEKELLRGKLHFLETQPYLPLSVFFDQYEKWAENNLAHTTVVRLKRILPNFKDVVGSQKSIHGIDFSDMDRFVESCRKRKHHPETINVQIRHIKAAFGWAANPRRKILKDNPFRGYKQIRYNKKPPAFLEIDQIQKVFDAIGKNRQYRIIFALYVYTGARREEIHRLEWKDLKVDSVRIAETKTYKPREVPISDSLANILSKYPRGVGRLFSINIDQMSRRIKYYLRKAGVGHLRPHDLRHTFASHLIMSGVDLKTVGELLGHTSYQATMIYAHLLKEHKVRAIAKLPY